MPISMRRHYSYSYGLNAAGGQLRACPQPGRWSDAIIIYTSRIIIYTSRLWLRIGATLLGIGYGAVGAFALVMSRKAPSVELADRAFWMGITFLIAAVAAIGVSWLVRDLSNIWCIPAKRSKPTRLDDDT